MPPILFQGTSEEPLILGRHHNGYQSLGGNKCSTRKKPARSLAWRVWVQMNSHRLIMSLCVIILCHPAGVFGQEADRPYEIVDTGQNKFFDNTKEVAKPRPGQPFYGQDAHFTRNEPQYTDNGDGSVTDHVTGLVWQASYSVLTYAEAIRKLKTFSLSGKSDWRLPSIQEVYSLALFSGIDASSRNMSRVSPDARPFISDVFDFKYGANGDRPIDTQMLSSTIYQGKTMGGQKTVFGFNAADGRIKGYPIQDPRRQTDKKFTVRYVRGNMRYGINDFNDNADGTISDNATGLMWSRADSGVGMNWQDALAWVEKQNRLTYLGYSDWRLPNAKEMHSIVDYTRSPQSTDSPAIAPLFQVTVITDETSRKNYPFFWTSTTHQGTRGGFDAIYICFGDAYGYFAPPNAASPARVQDVHGAGAQRSDPKQGTADQFPQGRGPQGDVIRILNYVRLVRNL